MTRRRNGFAKPTLIDRAVASVAPGLALKRLYHRTAFEALGATGGYTGGRADRRATKRWVRTKGDADADMVPQLETLRASSRDLSRNTPIALAVTARQRTNVVGSGIRPNPQIDADRLGLSPEEAAEAEAAILSEFNLHADSTYIDATRNQNFYGLQDLVFGGMLESGDCFTLRRNVANGNRVVGGVELDELGRDVAYHVQVDHPGEVSGTQKQDWSPIPRAGADGRDLMRKHYRRLRIGQTRGVPELAPVIETLKQLGTFTEAELMAAVIGSMITVVFKTDSKTQLDDPDPYEEGGTETGPQEYNLDPGTVLSIGQGDEATVPTVGRPNMQFDPFFVAIVRQLGAALEIPFEVLMMHFTSSFSASRAALEMAYQMWKSRQGLLVQSFCRPVYEDAVHEAVAAGRLALPGFFNDPAIRRAWLGCQWIGPSKLSIQPKTDYEADALAEDRGWQTAAETTAKITGGDWRKKQRQRAREKSLTEELDLTPAAPPAPPQRVVVDPADN
jgi:capsid protein